MNWTNRSYTLYPLTLVLLLNMFGGCASTKPQPYVPNPPDPQTAQTKLRVAVVEFENQSPPHRMKVGGSLGLIPGVLYEEMFRAHPITNFGSCLAEELQASKLFQQVKYFPDWAAGYETFRDYDVIVSGNLRHDRRASYRTTYGLSVIGIYLWVLGVPMEWEERDVSFDMWAIPVVSPYNRLVEKSVTFAGPTQLHNFYSFTSSGWHKDKFGRYESNETWDPCPSEQLQNPFLTFRNSLVNSALSQSPKTIEQYQRISQEVR